MATFRPSNPHFFQPLLPGFEHQFSIPVSFFKYLKGEEFDKIVLRSPIGKKLWNVKINGRKFEDGWKEFVKSHDLRVGYFLVFEHGGDLVFDVLVFDLSTCKKEYSNSFHVKEEIPEIPEEGRGILEEEEEEEEEGEEIHHQEEEDDEEIHQEEEEDDDDDDYNDEQEEIHEEEEEEDDDDEEIYQEEEEDDDEEIYQEEEQFARKSTSKKSRQKKVKRASAEIENPYFEATLTSSSFNQRRLPIPKRFARLHNLNNRCCKMLILDQEDRSWPVELCLRKSKYPQAFIGRGAWPACRDANGLKSGDSLIFQLIKNGKEPVFKLSKKLGTERPPMANLEANASSVLEHQEKLRKKQKPKTNLKVEVSSVLEQSSSCLEINVTSTYSLRSRAYINKKFTMLHNLKSKLGEIILMDQERREWPARLCRNVRGCCIYRWREFHEANGLKSGETLLFNITEKGRRPAFELCRRFTRWWQSATTIETKARSSTAECSYFAGKVTPSSDTLSRMYIPSSFAKINNLINVSEIVLVNQEGRSWSMKLYSKNPDEFYICRWKRFSVANDLKLGDSFIFVLIEKGKRPILKMFRFNVKNEDKKEQSHQDDAEAGSSSTRLPYFYVTMKASFFKSHQITIPEQFAKWYGFSKLSEMIIENGKERSWSVSLEKDNAGRVYIGGWSEFAKANGLKAGSVFLLELVKRGEKPIMKFYGLNQGTSACNKS